MSLLRCISLLCVFAWFWFILIALPASGAQAPYGSIAQVQAELQRAERAFNNFANAKARRILVRVDESFVAQPAWLPQHQQVLVETLLLSALIHHSEGKTQAMRSACARAAQLAPTRKLSTAQYPGSLRAAFIEAQAVLRTVPAQTARTDSVSPRSEASWWQRHRNAVIAGTGVMLFGTTILRGALAGNGTAASLAASSNVAASDFGAVSVQFE